MSSSDLIKLGTEIPEPTASFAQIFTMLNIFESFNDFDVSYEPMENDPLQERAVIGSVTYRDKVARFRIKAGISIDTYDETSDFVSKVLVYSNPISALIWAYYSLLGDDLRASQQISSGVTVIEPNQTSPSYHMLFDEQPNKEVMSELRSLTQYGIEVNDIQNFLFKNS
jgi:hypothetical protein